MQPSRRAVLAFPAIIAAARSAHAQGNWPDRPIRMVVPFAAGGAADITARLAAEEMSGALGQPVSCENRTGAGGVIGTEMVARARPDGHTLLNLGQATHAINPALLQMSFDPGVDAPPVAPIAGVPTVLIIGPQVPATNVAGFIALAKARPGALAYGSAGIGTATHMALALLAHRTGVELQHVPYRGTAVAMPDLLAGRLACIMDNLPSALPHIREGRVRALAVSTARRLAVLPEVPTVAETVSPGYDVINWYGIGAPAGTPAPILARLQQVMAAAMAKPEFCARLAAAGLEPIDDSPAEFAAYIAADRRAWTELVRAANISAS